MIYQQNYLKGSFNKEADPVIQMFDQQYTQRERYFIYKPKLKFHCNAV